MNEIGSASSENFHGQAKSKAQPKSNHTPSQNNGHGPATTPSEAPYPVQNPTSSSTVPSAPAPPNAHPEASAEPSPPSEAPDFEAYYLQKVTAEFADDIDKVRNASDFKESSVPILIEALRQGAVLYGEEERKRVMGGLGT